MSCDNSDTHLTLQQMVDIVTSGIGKVNGGNLVLLGGGCRSTRQTLWRTFSCRCTSSATQKGKARETSSHLWPALVLHSR